MLMFAWPHLSHLTLPLLTPHVSPCAPSSLLTPDTLTPPPPSFRMPGRPPACSRISACSGPFLTPTQTCRSVSQRKGWALAQGMRVWGSNWALLGS